MKVIIIGCGRVGSLVAQSLEAEGHSVAVIDRNPDAFRRLPEGFIGKKIVAVGIEETDALLALTDGDNTNAMVAQMARDIFHVPDVLACINDPLRADTYHGLGIPTICQTAIMANPVLEKILEKRD